MKKIIYFFVITFIVTVNCNAQGFIWAKKVGAGNNDEATCVKVDGSGNVYTSGFFQGTADFDPGPATFNMTSAGLQDAFILKLDPSGNFLWAKRIGGTGADFAQVLIPDAGGNIIISGNFANIVDLDPGPAVSNYTSFGSNDIYVLKLDGAGNYLWAKQMGGAQLEAPLGIKLDATANILISGNFDGIPDFDPGPSVTTLTASGIFDIFILKLDPSGNFTWVRGIGDVNNDTGESIALDAAGNVHVTGTFNGTVDFDPGAAVFNLTSGGFDPYILKLDAAGNFVWARVLYNNTAADYGMGIAVDASGNVYSTGRFANTMDFDPGPGIFNLTAGGTSDSYVSKLNSAGNFVWAAQLGGPSAEYGEDIALDAVGDVYSTGYFSGIADFNPAAASYTLSAAGSADIYVSKLNSAGAFVWASKMGGTAYEIGYSIYVDVPGNIYTCGHFSGTCDFNPTAGSYTLISAGLTDAWVQKMGTCAGAPVISSTITGSTSVCPGSTYIYSITAAATATSYNWILPLGWIGTSTTNIISVTAGTSGNFSVTATSSCGTSSAQTLSVTVNSSPTITVNSGSICSSQSFTIIPSGASTYTIQGGSAIVSPTTNTSYTVIGTSTSGCISNIATSNVTVNTIPIQPSAITGNTLICSNTSQAYSVSLVGGNSYTWTLPGGWSGTSTSNIISTTAGITSGVISVAAINACGTSPTRTIAVTVNPVPSITISPSSNPICNLNTVTLTAAGASTYSWNTGPTTNTISQFISFNTTFTVTGTLAGCSSSSSIAINILTLPQVLVSSNSVMICVGQNAVLTASGAVSYTWYPTGSGSSISVSPTVTTSYTVVGTGVNGCTNTSTFNQGVSPCTGLTIFNSQEEEMLVYPNPFSNKITVSIAGESSIKIYNTIGMLVYSSEIKNKKDIDLSELPIGIYFIRTDLETIKIIKE